MNWNFPPQINIMSWCGEQHFFSFNEFERNMCKEFSTTGAVNKKYRIKRNMSFIYLLFCFRLWWKTKRNLGNHCCHSRTRNLICGECSSRRKWDHCPKSIILWDRWCPRRPGRGSAIWEPADKERPRYQCRQTRTSRLTGGRPQRVRPAHLSFACRECVLCTMCCYDAHGFEPAFSNEHIIPLRWVVWMRFV